MHHSARLSLGPKALTSLIIFVAVGALAASQGLADASSASLTPVADPQLLPPSVTLTSPTADQPVSCNTSLTASTTGPINAVKWYINGVQVAWDSNGPAWEQKWNSTTIRNGEWTAIAFARTTSGQWVPSKTVITTVDNTQQCDPQLLPPSVTLTSPTADQPVSCNTSLTASTTGPINAVKWYINGVQVAWDSNGPAWEQKWNSTTIRNGEWTAIAFARTTSGQWVPSKTVITTVDNTQQCDPQLLPPSVTLTSPTADQPVSCNTSLTASTTGPINAVKWYINGVQVAWDSNGPAWEQKWNSTTIRNGEWTAIAFARTTSGQWVPSKTVITTVDNTQQCDPQLLPPSVTLTSPTADQPVSCNTSLTASTTGPINAVKWYINGVQVAWDSNGPAWEQKWNSTTIRNGEWTAIAFARTTSGQWVPSKTVITTVDNTQQCDPQLLPPSVTLTSPTADQPVSGSTSLTASTTGPINAVKWYINGVQVAWDSNGPAWEQKWNSTTIRNGEWTAIAFARTTSGQWVPSKTVITTVDNTQQPDVAPTSTTAAPSSSTTTSTTAAPPLSTTGSRAPVGALPGWRHLFVDDFDQDVPLGSFPQQVSSKWDAYPYPWRDTSRNGYYAPQRVVSISNGILQKDLRTVDGEPSVAALLPKVPGSAKFGTLYGRYEVRFRSTKVSGYKIAWLLWPDSGTNVTGSSSGVGGNGEIDFPEMGLDSDHVMGFVHRQDAVVGSDQYWAKSAIDITQWHTYTIEWSPNSVVFLLDGYEVGRTTERIPNSPMHWVLQTETQLSGGKPSAEARGKVEIDWVSVWAYDAETFGSAAPPPLSPSAYPVRVTAPAADATVRGTVPLEAGLLGDTYSAVHWFIRQPGGPAYERIAMDNTGPTFSSTWDTRTIPNGQISLWANAKNSSGQWIGSRSITITINN